MVSTITDGDATIILIAVILLALVLIRLLGHHKRKRKLDFTITQS